MSFKQHFVYWIFPTTVVSLLIAMYFSQQPTLMWIMAPEVNRELGLLESLQHLLLLIMAIVWARAAWKSQIGTERALYILIGAGTAFVLLEELNYFTHYWWAINGWDFDTLPGINVHNKGDLSDNFKDAGDIFLIGFFVLFPLAAARIDNAWVNYLRPSRMFILALICALLTSRMAHFLEESYAPENNYFSANIGEYRELFVYWIWLLYSWILTQYRQWPLKAKTA